MTAIPIAGTGTVPHAASNRADIAEPACLPDVPGGAPLLWAPFFAPCHLWLGLLNLLGADFVRDGFSNPYQRAVGIWTVA
jgi:hypothetical protein